MTEFKLVEARLWHCGQIARALRHEHHASAAKTGLNIHAALQEVFYRSASYRHSWTIDGHLAAMGGVTGSLMSDHGSIWFAMTQAATRYPVATARLARKMLAEIMQMKREVSSIVLYNDAAALRFVQFLDFETKSGLPNEFGQTVTKRGAT